MISALKVRAFCMVYKGSSMELQPQGLESQSSQKPLLCSIIRKLIRIFSWFPRSLHTQVPPLTKAT